MGKVIFIFILILFSACSKKSPCLTDFNYGALFEGSPSVTLPPDVIKRNIDPIVDKLIYDKYLYNVIAFYSDVNTNYMFSIGSVALAPSVGNSSTDGTNDVFFPFGSYIERIQEQFTSQSNEIVIEEFLNPLDQKQKKNRRVLVVKILNAKLFLIKMLYQNDKPVKKALQIDFIIPAAIYTQNLYYIEAVISDLLNTIGQCGDRK